MSLNEPLLSLVKACETLCSAECCGIDAFEFSPLNIAHFLRSSCVGTCDREQKFKQIKRQIEEIRDDYGTDGKTSNGVTIDEMNEIFRCAEVDGFCEELLHNLDAALKIIELADDLEWKQPCYTKRS